MSDDPRLVAPFGRGGVTQGSQLRYKSWLLTIVAQMAVFGGRNAKAPFLDG